MSAPLLVLFAGVNGAGKTTLYRSGVWQHGYINADIARVNPDEIIVRNGWNWSDSQAQLRAAKDAVKLIHSHLDTRTSFCQETTLCGKSVLANIRRAHSLGYYIVLFYVGLQSAELANQRIAHRVEVGGHDIDANRVRRRYVESIANFGAIIDLCNEAYLYDNTALLDMVARFELGELAYVDTTRNDLTWHLQAIAQAGYEEVAF